MKKNCLTQGGEFLEENVECHILVVSITGDQQNTCPSSCHSKNLLLCGIWKIKKNIFFIHNTYSKHYVDVGKRRPLQGPKIHQVFLDWFTKTEKDDSII